MSPHLEGEAQLLNDLDELLVDQSLILVPEDTPTPFVPDDTEQGQNPFLLETNSTTGDEVEESNREGIVAEQLHYEEAIESATGDTVYMEGLYKVPTLNDDASALVPEEILPQSTIADTESAKSIESSAEMLDELHPDPSTSARLMGDLNALSRVDGSLAYAEKPHQLLEGQVVVEEPRRRSIEEDTSAISELLVSLQPPAKAAETILDGPSVESSPALVECMSSAEVETISPTAETGE